MGRPGLVGYMLCSDLSSRKTAATTEDLEGYLWREGGETHLAAPGPQLLKAFRVSPAVLCSLLLGCLRLAGKTSCLYALLRSYWLP